jgi:phosphoribosylaminoimidazolecarboxamide formyltransferase/IMP cyclohydrolase
LPEPTAAALISVYDRTGVVDLARALAAAGTAIYATGGTAAHLRRHLARHGERCARR